MSRSLRPKPWRVSILSPAPSKSVSVSLPTPNTPPMSKFNEVNEQIGKYRWTICALVFFATTINYLDRNVLGLLKDTLAAKGIFGVDKAEQELNYSNVVICFTTAYAVGMVL